jgi:hypothetical protein
MWLNSLPRDPVDVARMNCCHELELPDYNAMYQAVAPFSETIPASRSAVLSALTTQKRVILITAQVAPDRLRLYGGDAISLEEINQMAPQITRNAPEIVIVASTGSFPGLQMTATRLVRAGALGVVGVLIPASSLGRVHVLASVVQELARRSADSFAAVYDGVRQSVEDGVVDMWF